MGFPRILSKNNKIYTKLGEFCLSIDGNQFFIVCHTCQQELQTQDNFWKHIQDEHSFMHQLKQENQMHEHRLSQQHQQQQQQHYLDSVAAVAAIEVSPPAASLVPHYRKLNERLEQTSGSTDDADEAAEGEDDDDQEPKDYTEMRVIEPSAVQVDIKVEQPQLTPADTTEMQTQSVHPQPPPPPSTTLYMPNAAMNYANLFQSMPQVVIPGGAAGANMSGMLAPLPHDGNASAVYMPKDSSSANSEDGERWYICDYETCGLKFKYQSRLELHRSVHSKVRRFACDHCNASFKQSCNLSTHRKKKHNIKGNKFEPRF